MNFTHLSLRNPGVTTGQLSENLYNQVMNEVNDILFNFNLHSSYSNGLAGNIERQYKLEKSIPIIQPYLNEMCKSYSNYWNFYQKDNDFELTHLWVNYQKKNEFNPIHHHSSTFSFVCWLKIPYNVDDELNAPHAKNTNAKAASTFQFIYPNILGQISIETLYVNEDWSGKIILFPSSLSHCVYPFTTSDDYRISISGNLI